MKILIDTNRYSDLCIGETKAVDVFRQATHIFMPLIVLAELRAGFAFGARQEGNEKNLVRFLNSPRVSVLHPDEQTTHFYAQIYSELRKKGRPIPTHDIWIAALALQHDCVLFDRDSDFDAISRLVRI
jgi:predicted nucleic acid-binding protein